MEERGGKLQLPTGSGQSHGNNFGSNSKALSSIPLTDEFKRITCFPFPGHPLHNTLHLSLRGELLSLLE